MISIHSKNGNDHHTLLNWTILCFVFECKILSAALDKLFKSLFTNLYIKFWVELLCLFKLKNVWSICIWNNKKIEHFSSTNYATCIKYWILWNIMVVPYLYMTTGTLVTPKRYFKRSDWSFTKFWFIFWSVIHIQEIITLIPASTTSLRDVRTYFRTSMATFDLD